MVSTVNSGTIQTLRPVQNKPSCNTLEIGLSACTIMCLQCDIAHGTADLKT